MLELKRIHTKAIDKDRKAGSCEHEGHMPFASAAHASMSEQGGYKDQEPLGTQPQYPCNITRLPFHVPFDFPSGYWRTMREPCTLNSSFYFISHLIFHFIPLAL